MASVNQENVEFREEVCNLKEGMKKLTTMMNALLASQAAQDQAVQVQAAQAQAALNKGETWMSFKNCK